MSRLRSALHRLRMTVKPLSVGVRVHVTGENGSILLVRHTYVPGWHFPGGGVDAHETAAEAAAREVREETAVEIATPPSLVGVFFNRKMAGRDHVLFFRSTLVARGDFRPGLEIAEARFFLPHELPDDLSRGTRRRLAELAGEAGPDAEW